MKLAFSTNGREKRDFYGLCGTALAYGFDGIELHDLSQESFTGENGPLTDGRINAARRFMAENGLSVPCIDCTCNMGDINTVKDNAEKIKKYITAAAALKCRYVRLYARRSDAGNEDEAVKNCLNILLPYAQKNGVILLIETVGVYADTQRLKTLLDSFASDTICALWDVNHPYRFGESAEQTVKNLGAYIKHVHLKDSLTEDGKTHFCLMGEGDLPINEFIAALRSINYDGYFSLEILPAWVKELGEDDIMFTHFVNYMSRFDDTSRKAPVYYYNNRHTGRYIWKKDALIDLTFSQLLDRMADEFPDQCALKYTTLDYTRTYSQLRDDVNAFAKALIALGVKQGSHVAIWATNVPQWYLTFWAATKIGAVLVTVNTAYKISEAQYLLAQSDTHTLVMVNGFRDSDYAAIMNELCPELTENDSPDGLHARKLPFLRNIITVDFSMKGCLSWEQALAAGRDVPDEELSWRAAAVNSHDVANMQYTSGTTGFPKGVMLTHYNIVNNGKCIGDRMDLSTADRMMIQVPMFHCFGMVLAMTACVTHSATILPLPYFSAKPALDCIHQQQITCFHGVPTMFIAMLNHPDFARTDFSYMRTGIMAGSPCPVAVMKDVVEKMHMDEITIVYGQTEASPGCTMSSTDDPLEVRVETVGRPLPEIECKIVDPETGADLPDDTIGEFVARGYNIMKGYYKMPKATAETVDADGWLHTGDLALRTPEGNYRITGRLKDMIIRGGENIYPKEIEEFIYTHPKVSDVQVIGVPDDKLGEEIMACIILKENEEMTADEMKKYVGDNMAHHKIPRYIEFTDEFPTNVAGKILKYKMRADAIDKLGLKKT